MKSVDNTDISEAVFQVLDEILRPSLFGKQVRPIRPDHLLVRDLKLDGDDFSFVFVPSLERKLGVKTTQADWNSVQTVQDAIDVFTRRLQLRDRR